MNWWHGVLFVVLVFGAGGAWAVLRNDVKKLTEKASEQDKSIDVLKEKVSGLLLIAMDDGRHTAAAQGLMSKNSPWRVTSQAREFIEKFGAAPDLKDAWEKTLANGPLPDDDDGLLDRVLRHTTLKRLAERAEEVKRPFKVYLALFLATLRQAKAMGRDEFLQDIGLSK